MSDPVTPPEPRPPGKRIRADICPFCGKTVLAPQSLDKHIETKHGSVAGKQAFLPALPSTPTAAQVQRPLEPEPEGATPDESADGLDVGRLATALNHSMPAIRLDGADFKAPASYADAIVTAYGAGRTEASIDPETLAVALGNLGVLDVDLPLAHRVAAECARLGEPR